MIHNCQAHTLSKCTPFRPLLISTVAGLVLLASCAPRDHAGLWAMRSIDEDIDRAIQRRSEQLGVQSPPESADTTPAASQIKPTYAGLTKPEADPSANPPAEQLSYSPRQPLPDFEAETAAITERLAAYRPPAGLAAAQDALPLDLPQALAQAQLSAREFLSAEENYILAAIGLLIEEHRWSPRLFNDTTARVSSSQVDGSSDTTLRVINELRATQRLPFGGDVAARWTFDATENLRSSVSDQYQQSSQLAVDASIPLMRGAGPVARESLIQSRRDLVYAARTFERFRRRFLASLARDYFNLLEQQAQIDNQQLRLRSLQSIERRQRALYDAGRIQLYDVNNATNDVLGAQLALANTYESYTLALDRFKIRLGLPVDEQVVIVPVVLMIDEPAITPDAATQLALHYRLDLQNERDRLLDDRRAVLNARNALLPDLDLTGSAGLRTDADEDEGGVIYELDDAFWSAGITLGLPLDRRIERLSLRQQMISYEQAVRSFDEFRDGLVLDVRARVREIERARFNLLLSEKQVEITKLRQREQEIKADEVTTQELLDTEQALLNARSARDRARTDLRNAVLDYLVATGQMRVGRGGQFEPLPGMRVRMDEPSEENEPPVDESDDKSEPMSRI